MEGCAHTWTRVSGNTHPNSFTHIFRCKIRKYPNLAFFFIYSLPVSKKRKKVAHRHWMTHCSLCVCLRYQALFWVWVSTGTHLPRLMLVRSSWPWIHPYVLLYVVKRPQQSFRPLRGESLLSASSILTGREEREQPTARRAFCVNSDLVVTNTVTISACVDRHEDKVIKMRRVQLHFSVRNISLDFFIPKVCDCVSCPP